MPVVPQTCGHAREPLGCRALTSALVELSVKSGGVLALRQSVAVRVRVQGTVARWRLCRRSGFTDCPVEE